MPSLRQRREDVPLLVSEFLVKFSPSTQIQADAQLLDKLKSYDWPGNIRELENLVERMVVLRKSNHLTVVDLPPEFLLTREPRRPEDSDIGFHDAEKQLVLSALQKNNWNKSRAAAQLKIPRHILLYRMKKYDIRPPEHE